ncbi:MAG: 50S ribosomal protein L7ae [Gemmatimonadales bacterium]|nr:50S ribosomal protein L7ae [Gemmatimonadales bacterium]MYG50698.1 50S ribosomal protein L7ae [Gemmatimonadales bacterium]MYK02696.1 50S ribosomal protein L7ae [Candidatus Palauibacter ramosifaciens]
MRGGGRCAEHGGLERGVRLKRGGGRRRAGATLGLLGIATRAGRVALGTRAVDIAARRGRLALLVVAGDASRHAVSRLTPQARQASRVTVASRKALGRALGRNNVAVVGVTDSALAQRILEGERTPSRRDESSGSRGDPEGRVPGQ